MYRTATPRRSIYTQDHRRLVCVMAKGCLLGFLLVAWASMCICQVDWRTTADLHSSSSSLTTSGESNTDQKTSWQQEAFLYNRQHDGRHRPLGPNFLPSSTISSASSSSSRLAKKSDMPEPRGVKAEIDYYYHRRHQRIGQSDPTSSMTRSPTGTRSSFFSHLLLPAVEDLSMVERDNNGNTTTSAITGHAADNSNPNSAIVELNNGWNKSESSWTQSEGDAVLGSSPSSNDDKGTRDHIVKCGRGDDDDGDQGQASVMMEQEAVQLPTSFLGIVPQLIGSPLVTNLFQLIVKSMLGDFVQTEDDFIQTGDDFIQTKDDIGMTHTIKKESSHNQNQLETLQDLQVVAASQIQKIFLEQLSQIISSWLAPRISIHSKSDESLENNKIETVQNSMTPRGWTVLGPGPTKAVIAAGILIALAVYGRTWRYVIPNEYALQAITIPPELFPTTEEQHPLPTPGRRSMPSISFEQQSAMMIFDTAIPRPNLDRENVYEDLYSIDPASSSPSKSEYRSKNIDESSSSTSI